MEAPPLLSGALKLTVAVPLPKVADTPVGALGTAMADTLIERDTLAGTYVLLPDWDAVTEQVPVAMKVKLLPETLHTSGVADANVTAKPDVELALKVVLCPTD